MVTAPAENRLAGPPGTAERARALRLVLADCDGVLTDGTVYYSAEGEVMKRFSLRDGMGVERLRDAGIATAILTRERSAVVARRAQKLGLPYLFEGVPDKLAYLPAILSASGLTSGEVAFIGDDVNDLGLLRALGREGLTAAPADAMPEVLASVHYRCLKGGGQGAFREFAEWILARRGDFTETAE